MTFRNLWNVIFRNKYRTAALLSPPRTSIFASNLHAHFIHFPIEFFCVRKAIYFLLLALLRAWGGRVILDCLKNGSKIWMQNSTKIAPQIILVRNGTNKMKLEPKWVQFPSTSYQKSGNGIHLSSIANLLLPFRPFGAPFCNIFKWFVHALVFIVASFVGWLTTPPRFYTPEGGPRSVVAHPGRRHRP